MSTRPARTPRSGSGGPPRPAGQPIPCRGPERAAWTSEHPAERERAATACQDCPVTDECRDLAVAIGATWGVWGGLDMSAAELAARQLAAQQRRRRRRAAVRKAS